MTSDAARRSEDRVDWAQVRLLLGASWRIKWNLMRQRKLGAVFSAIALSIFAVYAVLLSYAVGEGVHAMRAEREALGAAAVHLTFLWVLVLIVVTPILGFRGNEFLDVTKILVMPVGHRTVFAATLAGLTSSLGVLFLAMPVVAAVIGYGGSAGDVAFGVLAALLLVVTAVAIGQFVLLAFLDKLKSRKWRDLTMVLVPLIAGGAYVALQIGARRSAGEAGAVAGAVEWFRGWMDWTLPLPSWWAANAVVGGGWTRLLPVVALVAIDLWLVQASAVLQERTFYGEVEDDAPIQGVGKRGLLSRVASRFRDPIGALAERELAILRREPAVRTLLIGQSIFVIMWGGLAATSAHGHALPSLARYAPLAGLVAYPLLVLERGVFMNLLGIEGGGAVHSMLLPVKRRVILLGRDVGQLIAFGTLNAVVGAAATVALWAATGAGSAAQCAGYALLAAVEGYCAAAIGLGLGNVSSVATPIRVAVKDRRAIRQQMSGLDGCVWTFIRVVATFATLAVATPLALLFHWPYASREFGWPLAPPSWAIFVTAPLAVAAAFGLMYFGAWFGGALFESREEEIAARLTKSEE